MKRRAHSSIDKAAAERRQQARARRDGDARAIPALAPFGAGAANRTDGKDAPAAKPARARRESAASEVERKYRRLAILAAQRADDLRGREVCVLDLRGIVDYTDFAVIVTANNATHVRGIGRDVEITLRAENAPNPVRHGESGGAGGWTVWDYGDLVLHVLDEAARAHYRLEELWRTATRIDWDKRAALAAASASTTPVGEENMAKTSATPKKATPAAKKPAAKKAPVAKKPAAKKAAPAKKAPVAKKPVAKKPVAKKAAPAKKAPVAKKPAAKKPVAAKKPAVKKAVAKKPVAKKPVAKKAIAKK